MPVIANMGKVNGIVISNSPGVPDAHVLIATATASSSATLSFTLGLDSLYDIYQFRFSDIHPQTNSVALSFQVNAVGASGFNETVTSSFYRTKNHEDDSSPEIAIIASYDQAQGTGYQLLCNDVGNGDDESVNGILTLYAPSSTTYVKHFTIDSQGSNGGNWSARQLIAGYVNTTSAVNAIQFSFHSGNIDTGVITMYGIAKS